ncbi:MAG: molybdopterin-dependent oxidoreductase [Dehalococcoidia bacterium]
MPFSRRQFLKLAGISSLGAVVFKACGFAEKEILVQSPVQLPEDLVTGTDTWYASTCRQCPAGCGNIVRVMEGRAKKIEGNPNHPISRGKLCVRGQAGLQGLYHPDRIQEPLRRVGERGIGAFESLTWEAAEADLAQRLRNTSSSRVLLATEPLRGRLALVVKRFVDASGIRYASFEPMERSTNLKAAMEQLFGQSSLPEFDLENTRFLMGFGVDLLETWLSTVRYNRGYGTFRQGPAGTSKSLEDRGTFVQVDSRFSMTAANADEWVPVKPGMEGILALSMAYVIIDEGLGDRGAADAMTGGRGIEALASFAPNKVAGQTGVSEQRVIHLARRFAREQPSLAIGGNSAGAHTNGLFNLIAIYSLNVLVGSVGVKGGLFFNPEPLSPGPGNTPAQATFRDWQRIAGSSSDFDLLMFRGANPIHGLPQALGFQEKLLQLPFIVSFSSFMDDTTAQADLILPDHTYLESWGDDVPDPGPGYEMVTIQQPTVNPFFKTRAFGDVLINLANRLGGEVASALPWSSFKEVVRDGARDLQALGRGNLRADDFETFWNGLLQRGVWYDTGSKPQSKATPQPLPTEPNLPVFENAPHEDSFNLVLYQSNSMIDGRLANLPWLQASPDPMTTVVWDTWADISLEDARRLKIKTNDIVEIRSQHGAIEVPAYVNRGAPPGTVSVPLGQGHAGFGRYAENRGVNPISILAPLTDPNTGALAWNATRVKVTKTIKERTLPKFEGSVESLPAPTTEVIQVVQKG